MKKKEKATVLIDKYGQHYNPERIWVVQYRLSYPTRDNHISKWYNWRKYKSEAAMWQAYTAFQNDESYQNGTININGITHKCLWEWRGIKIDYNEKEEQ